MTPEDLLKLVWEIIDNHCMEMSQNDYLSFLQELSSDSSVRADAVEMELEDDILEDDTLPSFPV